MPRFSTRAMRTLVLELNKLEVDWKKETKSDIATELDKLNAKIDKIGARWAKPTTAKNTQPAGLGDALVRVMDADTAQQVTEAVTTTVKSWTGMLAGAAVAAVDSKKSNNFMGWLSAAGTAAAVRPTAGGVASFVLL